MGFDTVSRLFHWVTVLLVALMIPVGLVMTQDVPRSLQDPLFILHKGLGPIVLAVVLARLLWRSFHPAPPLPASVPRLQVRAARLVQGALYFFLILQGVSGYIRVTTGGFPIEGLEALGIPPLLPKAEGVGKLASAVHRVSAICLLVLIAMHVAGAAYHGLVRRDGVFSSMWPPVAPRRPPARRLNR
jgi:cytochrome b561